VGDQDLLEEHQFVEEFQEAASLLGVVLVEKEVAVVGHKLAE
jgi:hypothetical protein